MKFSHVLQQAKEGHLAAKEEIFRMYQPLLRKYAMVYRVFDEDLYQELSAVLLHCIRKFPL